MTTKNKTVVVTGSSRGIGKAIAIAFAKTGANIVLNGRNPIPAELIKEIESYGVKVHSILGDMSDFDKAKQLIDETKEVFGSVDVFLEEEGKKKGRNSAAGSLLVHLNPSYLTS